MRRRAGDAPQFNGMCAGRFRKWGTKFPCRREQWELNPAGAVDAQGQLARTGSMDDVSHPGDYERSDADPRLIAALAAGIAIFLIVSPYLLSLAFPGRAQPRGLPGAPLPPPPRLQIDPKADLDRLHAAENRQLESYGWVDRGQGVARIPIERAMQLLAERGRPGWPAATPAPQR
jgi:hypothetical protein